MMERERLYDAVTGLHNQMLCIVSCTSNATSQPVPLPLATGPGGHLL